MKLDPCVGDDCRNTEPSWREAASIVTRVSPGAVTVLELRARETYRP